MRRAVPWLVGAVLVIAAGAVTAATPPHDALVAPFMQRGQVGDAVTSRTLVATALDATFADEIVVPDAGWQADGNWLVVTVVAAAPVTEVGATVPLATLVVGDRVFQASERPQESLIGTPLRVGVDTTGVLAFELPADLAQGTAELRLMTTHATAELDDAIGIRLPLGDLPRVGSLDIAPSGMVAP